MKTIIITGIGNGEVSPNQIELRLNLSTLKTKYDESISEHSAKLDKIVKLLVDLGFDKKDLKTDTFNVYPEYKSVRTITGDYKDQFQGYRVTQNLTLEFDLDMNKLSMIIDRLSKSGTSPKMNISFTIKEKEEFQNMLLENACIDAKRKAEVLAKVTNQKIVGIRDIDYSFSRINFYSNTRYDDNYAFESSEMCYKTASIADNINPSNISNSINVKFVFEVE
jgi:hypothetical protein